MISAELCHTSCDTIRPFFSAPADSKWDCLTVFLRLIGLGKATSFIWSSFYLREISLTFRPFVTFKHYTRIDGFKPIYTTAIIAPYSLSIKYFIKV